jgi:hypothetical protein
MCTVMKGLTGGFFKSPVIFQLTTQACFLKPAKARIQSLNLLPFIFIFLVMGTQYEVKHKKLFNKAVFRIRTKEFYPDPDQDL